MKISMTYHRPMPDTATGHKIVVTQVFSSMDKREIDIAEETFKKQYGSMMVAELDLNEFMFNAYYDVKNKRG